jgi:serralysin
VADLIATTNDVTNGDAYTLTSGNNLRVDEGIRLSASEAGGGILTAADGLANNITVKGTVLGATSGITSRNGGSTLTIRETGVVSGRDVGVATVGDQTVQNFGLITGGTAVRSYGGNLTLVNTGTVRALGSSLLAVEGENGGDLVTNSGRIEGSVRLWGGDDIYIGRGGSVTGRIDLMGGNDQAYGGTGAETFQGGTGNDTIDGGGGNDTAEFRASSNYSWSTASGVTTVVDIGGTGDGTDTLTNIRFLKFSDRTVMLHNASPDGLALSTRVIAETAPVNRPVATFSARDADGDALSYTLLDSSDSFRMDDNNLVLVRALDYETQARERTIRVEAKDNYGGSTIQSFTLSVANVIETTGLTLTGTAGADTLVGENGNDVISGLSGKDTLKGEDGNDRLRGALGSDTLSGGLGSDVFVFDARLAKSTASNKSYNLDRITDFSVPSDTLYLSKAVFKTIKKGMLASSAFHTGDKAHDASDRIIYNKKTGALLYDDDGIGAHAAIQFATLATNLRLTKSDFFVV